MQIKTPHQIYYKNHIYSCDYILYTYIVLKNHSPLLSKYVGFKSSCNCHSIDYMVLF